MSWFKKGFSILLPVMVILGAGVATFLLIMAKPEPAKKPPQEVARSIRVITARSGPVTLSVNSQGTVEAKQKINLVPQVAGQVVYVAENFVAGGQFDKGDIIVKLDPRDYQYAVTAAEARVAESRQILVREEAEAALARAEWDLLGVGEPSDLTLRKPQLADAKAKVKAAKASLQAATLDLERTVIRAPFNGLLTTKKADLGQFLSPGTVIGQYFSRDVVEVRLPLSNRDLSQLDMAELQSGQRKLDVMLSGRFAEVESRWQGTIVRTEGVIDSRTRILYAVAQLRGDQRFSVDKRLPITLGQFVSAKIAGRSYDKVFQLPREVLRQGTMVLVVDKNNKLRSRQVKVVESNPDFVVISEGLAEGDIICQSQLGADVDGLLVQYNLDQEAKS